MSGGGIFGGVSGGKTGLVRVCVGSWEEGSRHARPENGARGRLRAARGGGEGGALSLTYDI